MIEQAEVHFDFSGVRTFHISIAVRHAPVYLLENSDVVSHNVDGFPFSVDTVECVFAGIHQQSARRFDAMGLQHH